MKINDKLYFKVIFQTNIDVKEIIWYLGEPFYKKYTQTYNFDSKTLGFYFKKESDKEKDKDNDKIDNKKLILIIIISVEVIIVIALIVLGIILWKKYRDLRKNRVNEINDDNYEYFTDKKEKKEFSVNN